MSQIVGDDELERWAFIMRSRVSPACFAEVIDRDNDRGMRLCILLDDLQAIGSFVTPYEYQELTDLWSRLNLTHMGDLSGIRISGQTDHDEEETGVEIPVEGWEAGGTSWTGMSMSSSFVCDCSHDSCFCRRGDTDHYRECDCPKDTNIVRILYLDDGDWDSRREWFVTPDDAEDMAANLSTAVARVAEVVREMNDNPSDVENRRGRLPVRSGTQRR